MGILYKMSLKRWNEKIGWGNKDFRREGHGS